MNWMEGRPCKILVMFGVLTSASFGKFCIVCMFNIDACEGRERGIARKVVVGEEGGLCFVLPSAQKVSATLGGSEHWLVLEKQDGPRACRHRSYQALGILLDHLRLTTDHVFTRRTKRTPHSRSTKLKNDLQNSSTLQQLRPKFNLKTAETNRTAHTSQTLFRNDHGTAIRSACWPTEVIRQRDPRPGGVYPQLQGGLRACCRHNPAMSLKK